jgi:hypothetical protein
MKLLLLFPHISFLFRVLFFSSFLVFFISCKSSEKLDCSKINWRDFGQSLAQKGEALPSSLNKKILNCKSKMPFFDEDSFKAGYQDGLKLFCSTNSGFSFGKGGKIYENTCLKSSESQFLKGYLSGRIEYLNTKISTTKTQHANAKDRFWRKEQEYLLLKSEDPEQAKIERDFLDAFQEESNQLKASMEKLNNEVKYLKKQREEANFK